MAISNLLSQYGVNQYHILKNIVQYVLCFCGIITFSLFPQVFSPLVEKCKKYGRAMRIGTNHGSLSDRIMSYYGDSPRGMVSIPSYCHLAFEFGYF